MGWGANQKFPPGMRVGAFSAFRGIELQTPHLSVRGLGWFVRIEVAYIYIHAYIHMCLNT